MTEPHCQICGDGLPARTPDGRRTRRDRRHCDGCQRDLHRARSRDWWLREGKIKKYYREEAREAAQC